MLSFTIDKNDWIRGESITENHNDGGFSPLKKGQNIEFAQGGILYPQPLREDLDVLNSNVVTDEIIAFTSDPTFLGNTGGYALDDSGAFYTIDGTTVVKRQTDATNSYTSGTSDIINFQGDIFATSTTDIAKLTGTDLSTLDLDWWTATESKTALSSTYRHPMEVVEDTLYIADNYRIHTYDGTTSVYEAMLLPDMYNITSMIKHTDGRTLIVFAAETANAGHSLKPTARIFLIDTVNLEFISELPIDSQVEGSINVGGVIYVTFGANLGYFNGTGITFMRKLSSATTYKHCLANKEGTLIIRDNAGLLAYGDLGLGNIFWHPYQDERTSPVREIEAISFIGDNKMLISSVGRQLDLIDFDTFAGASDWDSNQYSFPGKVWIRKVVIETETLASGSSITLASVDKNGSAGTITTFTFAADGANSEKTVFPNIYTDLFRLRISFAAGNTKGIRKIIVYYEDGE